MTSHDLPSPSLGPEDQDKDKGEGGEGLEKPDYQSMSDVPAPAPTSQELKPALQAATTTPFTGLPAQAPRPPSLHPAPLGAGPATFGAGVPVQGGPPPEGGFPPPSE